MATTIDYRIVEAEFRNSKFDANIAKSTSSLNSFKTALNNVGAATANLEKVDSAADSRALTNLAAQVTKVSDKFSALGIVSMTVLQRITNGAIDAGISLTKSLSIDQISSGWSKYEAKTANIQSLVNSTGKSVEEINKYLDKLMMFSDETSYDFTTMTSALQQMVTTGGNIDKVLPLIEGIANATSFAGKGANEFSRIMYNLAQSYGQGYLTYLDWKSVALAGANSQQLIETFIDVGKSLGRLDSEGKTAEGTLISLGTFAESLSEKWVDTAVMEQAFGRFAQMTEAAYEMVQAGLVDTYSEAYALLDNAFEETYVRAALSAQEAKTFGEAINSVKDAVSSGWMATFEYIFGTYDVAKKTWTALANDLWQVFAAPLGERNKMLREWVDLGGQTALWEGLTNVFQALLKVVYAIREGFKEIFPSITAERLFEITTNFRDLTKNLEVSENTYNQFKSIASGIAAVLKLIITPLQLAVQIVWKLLSLAGPFGNVLLSVASYLGVLVTNIAKAIDNSRILEGIFEALTTVAGTLASAVKAVIAVISAALNSFTGVDLLNFQQVSGSLATIPPIGNKVAKVFNDIGDASRDGIGMAAEFAEKLGTWFGKAKDIIVSVAGTIGQALKPISDRLRVIFKDVTLTDAIGTTLLFGMYDFIKKIAKSLAKMKSSWAGLSKSIKNVFDVAGDTLKTFQNKINAETLKAIAISVGILAASLFLISKVDEGKLGGSLGAVSALFGELAIVLAILGGKKFAIGSKQIMALAGAMIGMAVAVKFLGDALATVQKASTSGDLLASAGALGLLMAVMTVLTKHLSLYAGDKDILRLSAVMLAFGFSVKVLATSLASFQGLDIETLGVGLVGLVVTLEAISHAISGMKNATGNLAGSASTLIAMGLGLSALAIPIKVLGEMKLATLERGFLSVLVLIGALTASLSILKLSSLSIFGKNLANFSGDLKGLAGSLLAMAVAVNLLIIPFRVLGQLNYYELEQGMNSLTLLIIELTASIGVLKAIPGEFKGIASTLLALAVSINLVMVPIRLFGTMNWKVMAIGLGTFAGALVTLVGSIYLIAKISKAFPGISKTMRSLALMAAGLGLTIAAITAGLGLLSTISAAGIAAIVASAAALLQGLRVLNPIIEEGLTDLVITVSNVISRAGPALIESLIVLLDEVGKQLVEYGPSITDSLGELILIIVQGLSKWSPSIQQAFKELFEVWFGDASRSSVLLSFITSAGTLLIVMKMLKGAKKLGKDALIGAGYASAVTLLIGGALSLVEQFGNTDNILQNALGIGAVMIAMSVAMRVAAPLGKLGLVALKGVGVVLLATMAVMGVFALIYSIGSQFPGLENAFQGALKISEYFGQFLGAFLGGMGKGFVGASTSLVSLAKNLSNFWTDGETFFEGLKNVDDTLIDKFKKLAEAVMYFAAGAFVNVLGKLPFTGSRIAAFAEGLEEAGPHLVQFIDSIKGIQYTTDIDEVVKVIEAMAPAAEAAPRYMGLEQLLIGHNLIGVFAAELAAAGPNLVTFVEAVKDLPEGAADCAKNAANVLIALANPDLIDCIPRYGGVVQWWSGGNNLFSGFANDIAAAAPDLLTFLNTMKGAPANSKSIAEVLASVITSMGEAAALIPKYSVDYGTGEQNRLLVFGDTMVEFSSDFVAYSQNLSNVDLAKMYSTTAALSRFTEVFASVDPTAMESVKNLVAEFSGLGVSSNQAFLNSFELQQSDVDDLFNKMYDTINGSIGSIMTRISARMTTLGVAMQTVLSNVVADGRKQLKENYNEWVDIGKNWIDGLKEGIGKKEDELITAIENLGYAVIQTQEDVLGIESPSKVAMRDGKYFVEGTAIGIRKNIKMVTGAVETLANKGLDTIHAVWGIHSPSTEGESTGENLDKGVSGGVENAAKYVTDAISNLGSKGGDALKSAFAKVISETGAFADDEAQKQFESIWSSTWDNYHQTSTYAAEGGEEVTKSLANSITKGSSSVTGAIQTLGQKMMSALSTELTNLGNIASGYDLEQQVWTALYSSKATTAQTEAVELAVLSSTLTNSAQQLALAEENYHIAITEYGKDSAEAVEAYNKLLQQQLATAQAAESLREHQSTAAEEAEVKMKAYKQWMKEYREDFEKMGFTIEEIEKAAQKETGWDPADYSKYAAKWHPEVEWLQKETSNEVASLADAVSEGVKQSFSANASLALTSLIPAFQEYGGAYTQAIAEGMMGNPITMQTATGATLQTGLDAMKTYQTGWYNAGSSIIDYLAAGVKDKSSVLGAAVRAAIDSAIGSWSGTIEGKYNIGGRAVSIISSSDSSSGSTVSFGGSSTSKGAATAANASATNQAVSGTSTMEQDTTVNYTVNNTINQTNNSPKALSAAEIQRRTELAQQLATKTYSRGAGRAVGRGVVL